MRKINLKMALLGTLLLTAGVQEASGCAEYDPDYEYYNIFSQELISDPQYMPFLLVYQAPFYEPADSTLHPRNANIEEWSHYLGAKYDDVSYLVFSAKTADLKTLADGKTVEDKRLAFVTPAFVKQHQAALQYLRYAKYLEPYMRIIHEEKDDDTWRYYADTDNDKKITDVDYGRMTRLFMQKWSELKDNELRLRYAYQLVRLAHYCRKYDEAIKFFDTYVQPLNFKPEMYYYALSQKAGAERGLGKAEACAHFMQVFSHSKDLKETAYTSIFLGGGDDNTDLSDLINGTQTADERNDIYLLLGYREFNNPLSTMDDILKNTPDAIQAKVLMARAINSIERSMIPMVESYNIAVPDARYPIAEQKEAGTFLENALNMAKMAAEKAKEKDFWHISASYLCFLHKDFAQAKQHLAKVASGAPRYVRQKQLLEAYIDICEQPRITDAVEQKIYKQYNNLLSKGNEHDCCRDFIYNVLGNRYYLQGDYAKSFLATNSVDAIDYMPTEKMVDALDAFYQKTDKNEFEKQLMGNAENAQEHLAYVRGILLLTKGDFQGANAQFRKETRLTLSKRILGYNIREWFEHDEKVIMHTAYLSDFHFIPDSMDERQLTETLMQLQRIGKGSGDAAAKANYLVGNFFYNVSRTGYYRQLLRFDNNNGFCMQKYAPMCENYGYDDAGKRIELPQNEEKLFYIHFSSDAKYDNPTALSEQYLEKASKQAKNKELRARIAFSRSKVEQEVWDETKSCEWKDGKDNILISDREYFKTLAGYKDTKFYKDVLTYCKYFEYYVSRN